MQVKFTVNKKDCFCDVKPDELLSDTLRRLGFLSVKTGCDTGSCGICTVWLEEKPVLSCEMLTLKVQGKNITTIEGAQEEANILAQFLNAEGSIQCGYCSPGFLMTVIAMKRELKNPSEDDINRYLSGNLCRCTGYQSQLRGIKKYLELE